MATALAGANMQREQKLRSKCHFLPQNVLLQQAGLDLLEGEEGHDGVPEVDGEDVVRVLVAGTVRLVAHVAHTVELAVANLKIS